MDENPYQSPRGGPPPAKPPRPKTLTDRERRRRIVWGWSLLGGFVTLTLAFVTTCFYFGQARIERWVGDLGVRLGVDPTAAFTAFFSAAMLFLFLLWAGGLALLVSSGQAESAFPAKEEAE